jgi:hypothetical protein
MLFILIGSITVSGAEAVIMERIMGYAGREARINSLKEIYIKI